MDTDAINSDDFDFENRKRNFDIISKKLNKYYEHKFNLFKGNDLQYNNYLRKMSKLTYKGSLDYEGYKNYVEKIKELSKSKSKLVNEYSKYLLKDFTEKNINNDHIKNLIENQDLTYFQDNLSGDVESLVNSITAGINNNLNRLLNGVNVSAENSEFDDLRTLRLSKLLKKIRMGLVATEFIETSYQNKDIIERQSVI